MRPGTTLFAWSIFGASNVAHAVGWVLVVLGDVEVLLRDVAVGAVAVLLTAVGALLSWHRPENLIGWLFSAAGAVLAATSLAYRSGAEAGAGGGRPAVLPSSLRDLEEVKPLLTGAVRETVAPTHVTLWVRGLT